MPNTVRERLIAEDPASEAVLKPILRGRDIRPYRAQWAGLWLVDTHNGFGTTPPIDVAAYPAIKRHLDRHWSAIAGRQDKGATPYNLRNCAYYQEFRQEKLFWMDMSPVGRFAYSASELYCNNMVFMMIGPCLKYLCVVLNSSLVSWYMAKIARTSGLGLSRWEAFSVTSIPIPYVSPKQRTDFELAFDEARERQASTSRLLSTESMVHSLYGLTATEINFLDSF